MAKKIVGFVKLQSGAGAAATTEADPNVGIGQPGATNPSA